MKNKLFTYLMVGMIAVTGISTGAPSLTVCAETQDEGAAYCKYLNTLIAQGYSMDDIDEFVTNNTDGTIRNGLPILKQAVENGTLKKMDLLHQELLQRLRRQKSQIKPKKSKNQPMSIRQGRARSQLNRHSLKKA